MELKAKCLRLLGLSGLAGLCLVLGTTACKPERRPASDTSDFFPKPRSGPALTVADMERLRRERGILFGPFWRGMNVYELDDLADVETAAGRMSPKLDKIQLRPGDSESWTRFGMWVVALDGKKFQRNEYKQLSSITLYVMENSASERSRRLKEIETMFRARFGAPRAESPKASAADPGESDEDADAPARPAADSKPRRSTRDPDLGATYSVWEDRNTVVRLRRYRRDLLHPQFMIRDRSTLGREEIPAISHMRLRKQ